MSNVQKSNKYRGYKTICPILSTTPFGIFITYQRASKVYLPSNVGAGTAGCNPNVNTFVPIPSGAPIPVCCRIDNVFANSVNILP